MKNKITSPEIIKARLKAIKSSTLQCRQAVVPLPPGAYYQKSIEIALLRAIQNTNELIQIVEILMESKNNDFWNDIRKSDKYIQGKPHWYSAGISLNPTHFETYDSDESCLKNKK